MDRIYYLGRNGLEYLTEFDATHYGGGLQGRRIKKADEYEYFDQPKTPLEQAQTSAVGAAPEYPPETLAPVQHQTIEAGNIDAATDDQLRSFLKQMKVRGAHLFGRAKLLENVKKLLS